MSIVYRTENRVNNKFYYGVHSSNNDNYLGSGTALKHAIRIHGKDNFIRRPIKENLTEAEAYELEELIVDQVLVDDPMCYNISLGGLGGVGKSMPWNKGETNCYTKEQIGILSKHKLGNTNRTGTGFITEISKKHGIPTRTLHNWLAGKCKPHNTNAKRLAIYILVLAQKAMNKQDKQDITN